MLKNLIIVLLLGIKMPVSAQVLSKIGDGYAQTSVNTAVFRQSSVVTHGNCQFAAYYDADGYVVVAKRKLDFGGKDGEWTCQRTQYKGNVQDAHNVISIGVSGDGILHLSFDHHGHPLKYCKSKCPLGLEFGDLQPMNGKDESNVTYPEFYNMPDGDLLFAYRSGSSGRGNLVMKRYCVKKKLWENVQEVLIDGENERNAYWQLCVDRQGVIHVSWVWRETPDVATNHDLCYARSSDGGKTWQKSNGEIYSLPITAATAETAFSIPQNSELINQTSMTADDNGNPYIATYWRDADSDVPQYRLVWKDNRTNAWTSCKVFERRQPFSLGGVGTKMIPISRPRLAVCQKGGRTAAYYLFRDAERGSKVSMAYCNDLAENGWKITDLTDFAVDAWEPSYDISLWNEKKRLDIFVQQTKQGDGEKVQDSAPTPVFIASPLTPMWSSGFVGRRSFRVPDGNYTVTMVIGSKKKAAQTTVRAENRRLFIQDLKTRKNEFKTVSFVVNKRTPLIDATTKVAINERERKTFTWDDSLTLEITGDAPEVQLVKIERNVDCPTVFLCGNSTVVDQYEEPWASWGQMFPVWFNSEIAIANHAESGLSTQSFLSSRRLDKILSVMKKGDYVIVEFGHNDEKDTRPGSGAWYNFSHNLKIFVDRVRAHGGNIIFCTPTSRRIWESDSLTISNTHGDYPAAIKAVAEREQVPLIDLTSMTKTFFETLGYEESKKALVHYPMGSFEGQTKALADNTHFSSYGAYEISKMVVKGLKQVNSPLVKFIADYWLLKAKSQ